jgi:hypothetical protein
MSSLSSGAAIVLAGMLAGRNRLSVRDAILCLIDPGRRDGWAVADPAPRHSPSKYANNGIDVGH